MFGLLVEFECVQVRVFHDEPKTHGSARVGAHVGAPAPSDTMVNLVTVLLRRVGQRKSLLGPSLIVLNFDLGPNPTADVE